jgi:hypothetical protein
MDVHRIVLYLENHSKNCVFPIVSSPEATFNIQKVSIPFFPSLKHNFIHIGPSSSLPFSRYSKIANGTTHTHTHTHIITHSSTFTCAAALFQAGKHSSDSALYASSSKNNAVLQSVGETI